MNNIDLNELINKANKGDTNAYYNLGNYLLESSGDYTIDRAVEMLKQAISSGHAGAMT